MANNPTVEEILNMKNYQLKEYLEDKHVPVPKKQSKEFLQSAALQTHAELEAEAAKKRIITRRRSKREDTDVSSTYSGMYGRSTSAPRSPPQSRSSPSPRSPSMTTRSKAKLGAQSPNRKQEDEAAVNLPSISHQEEDISYSSYSALLRPTTPLSPLPHDILASVNVNQEIDNAGESRQAAATPPPKQAHIEPDMRTESAAYAKLVMRSLQGNPDMAVPQLEVIKESIKASDQHESIKSRPYQEVVKKIIRVSGEADHSEKHKDSKKQTGHGDQAQVHAHGNGQGSRMQRLKRSGSMIVSQMNERVIKRLRKVPNHCRLHLARPSPHISIALLMCAVCVAAIGATSYWYHLKKLEEQRAQKRWLW